MKDRLKLSDEELARTIYLAGIKSCWGKHGYDYAACEIKFDMKNYRSSFAFIEKFPPIGSKQYREMRHHGWAHIDMAIDQARAVLKQISA